MINKKNRGVDVILVQTRLQGMLWPFQNYCYSILYDINISDVACELNCCIRIVGVTLSDYNLGSVTHQ